MNWKIEVSTSKSSTIHTLCLKYILIIEINETEINSLQKQFILNRLSHHQRNSFARLICHTRHEPLNHTHARASDMGHPRPRVVVREQHQPSAISIISRGGMSPRKRRRQLGSRVFIPRRKSPAAPDAEARRRRPPSVPGRRRVNSSGRLSAFDAPFQPFSARVCLPSFICCAWVA